VSDRVNDKVCIAGLLLVAHLSLGQTLESARGFRVVETYDPPHENQIKSLLRGARAQPLAEGRYQLTEVTLQTFRETGEGELSVKAPQCLYDSARHSANSPGHLQAQSADGKFSIEGDGFLWEQTNSCLRISNQVHTVVQPELLETSPGKPPPQSAKPPAAPMDIFADSFEYSGNSSNAVYRGHVRVAGTNLNLTANSLWLKVPLTQPRSAATPQSVTAEKDAVLDYATDQGKVHATGDRMEYTLATGLVRVTGHPAWRAEQREGRGDELVIDRTNRIFQALGHAWLKMPGDSLGPSGFLSLPDTANAQLSSAETNQAAVAANAAPGPKRPPAPGAHRTLEVASDSYEFRANPELHTNWGIFREQVRVTEFVAEQVRGKLACGQMTVGFAGSNELKQLVAERDVIIEQEDNRLTGAEAVYDVAHGTNGVLELSGPPAPTWQAGLRGGKGELLRIESGQLLARGNASMRLPARELDQAPPSATGATNRPSLTAPTNQFADIFAREYTVRTNSAVFLGGVYITHSNLNWVCETMTVQTLSPDTRMVIGQQGVIFDLQDEKARKIHGTGDKAVYTFGTMTNAIWLWGTPAVLATPDQKLTHASQPIFFDRLHNRMSGGGDFTISGSVKPTDTNLFPVPKLVPNPNFNRK
jgi:lipopolysaccharide transport protein LptA